MSAADAYVWAEIFLMVASGATMAALAVALAAFVWKEVRT